MDKHTLKANALADMRAVIAIEWALFNIRIEKNKVPPENQIAVDAYYKTDIVLGNELEALIAQCHKNLNLYMEKKDG